MPGIFRKERTTALSQTRVFRYLAYALGEIILIFVGVTLAVAFENRAETHRQDVLANGLLAGIRQNLDANVDELHRNLDYDRTVVAALRAVVQHMDTDAAWTDSLSSQLELSLHWTSPFFTTSGYESLKQAGLHSVSDETLRESIVHLFETTYGYLVGDLDRSMWVFMEAVMHPLLAEELIRTDSGRTNAGLLAPRDYEFTRSRGALRMMLLEHEALLLDGIALREEALQETQALMRRLDDLLE